MCGSQKNCGKFLEMGIPDHLTSSWKTYMQIKKQHLELDMEQQTGLGKECIKAVYCHPAYLTYAEHIMWNAKMDEAQAGIKIAGRNIKKPQICRWHLPNGRRN